MLDGPPPPAYTASEPYPLPTLSTLPFPVLTLVIHHIVRSPRSALDRAEVQQWMLREARLTSRMLYAVIQTYLRKTHLPDYLSHVRPPFSASPVPLSPFDPPVPDSGWILESVVYQPRETAVLDLFIAALVRERAEAMESEGYGESMNWREDVFTLYQPQARLLDLLLTHPRPIPLPFPLSSLTLRFTSRKITLSRTIRLEGGGGTRKRELVAFARERGETEEVSVRRMRDGLRNLRLLEEG